MVVQLFARKSRIISIGSQLFNLIAAASKQRRSNTEKIDGLQIYMRELDTANLVIVSIGYPTQLTQALAIEQATRSSVLEHASSQNSADPDLLHFAGSVTIQVGKQHFFQSSAAGFSNPEENVAVAIALLADTFELSIRDVIDNIAFDGGLLPEWVKDEEHYLYQIISKKR